MNLTVLRQSSRLVMAALNTAYEKHHEELQVDLSQIVADNIVGHVDITLDFQVDQANYETSFPLSVNGPESAPQAAEDNGQSLLAKAKSFQGIAEDRFRLASEACLEGEDPGWASSAFPSCDIVTFRSGGKYQYLGKRKHVSDSARPGKSKVTRTSEACEESGFAAKSPSLSPRPIIDYLDLPMF